MLLLDHRVAQVHEVLPLRVLRRTAYVDSSTSGKVPVHAPGTVAEAPLMQRPLHLMGRCCWRRTVPIPGYQQFLLPLLELAADGNEHTLSDAIEATADRLRVPASERDELLPSGTQTKLYNRVSWALTYLNRALLLDKAGRGRFRITERGRSVLAGRPASINLAFLDRFDEFVAFRSKRRANDADRPNGTPLPESVSPGEATPHERLDAAHRELRDALVEELLERVRASTPKFFEHLVVDLLKAMGYGGAHASRASVVGRSGDGGIDGVIPEDRLGLDMVYIQAKKWENSVGPDEIRKFVGSLGENKAHKGVFITSGQYTTGARTAADRANAKVVLIDGDMLAELMIDHGVGVADFKSYTVKKLDTDYFELV